MSLQFIPIDSMNLSPDQVATGVSVALGAFVLNRFTQFSGIVGFAINAAALFAGAQAASYLLAGMSLPFDYLIDRTLLISFVGMLAASFGMLILFSRPRRG